MILDIYRDCFARIYIWSPSVFVDHSWEPVKKHIEEEMEKIMAASQNLIYENEIMKVMNEPVSSIISALEMNTDF